MPQKHPDPFASRAARLNAEVNPYVAVLRDAAANASLPLAFGEDLASYPGRWRDRIAAFHKLEAVPERLVVEIGCHKGTTLTTMAAAHPETLFIGIDITFKRVVTTAQRAQALGLTNVFCVLANAIGIDRLFMPGELDGCIIFFPDPWVKKARQAKNRLVSEAFCSKLASRLAPGGFCWLKTDQEIYYAEARAAFDATGFRVWAEDMLVPAVIAADYPSSFQQRFAEQGLPTYAGKWRLEAEPHKLLRLPTADA